MNEPKSFKEWWEIHKIYVFPLTDKSNIIPIRDECCRAWIDGYNAALEKITKKIIESTKEKRV